MQDDANVAVQDDAAKVTETVTAVEESTVTTEKSTEPNVEATVLGSEKKEAEGELAEEQLETPEEIFAKEYIGKPEAYDYTEIMPEGWGLNEELSNKFNDLAGKFDISQKGASEFMTLAVDLAKQTQEGVLSALSEEIRVDKVKYNQEIVKDPQIGGSNLDETMRLAELAYGKFFQKEGMDLDFHNKMDKYGLNGHPTFVRVCNALGKQLQDDSIHQPGGPAGEPKSPAQILFGDTKK